MAETPFTKRLDLQDLTNEFIDFRLAPTESIRAGAARITRLQTALGALDAAHAPSELMTHAVFLAGLPPAYATTVDILKELPFKGLEASLETLEKQEAVLREAERRGEGGAAGAGRKGGLWGSLVGGSKAKR